jgi:hypothetical protein
MLWNIHTFTGCRDMPRKPRKPPIATDNEQIRKFHETARAVGAEEDEAAVREKLRVIARHKPVASPAPLPTKSKPRPKKVT